MQVILKEKIRKLGGLGETVNVKPGFARNYLMPQDKAMRATKANLAAFESQRAHLEQLESEKLNAAQTIAVQLNGLSLVISAKAGEGGKLFGSIGTHDLADAIVAKGITVAKHQVRLPMGALRQVGEYEIAIHLHSDLESAIKVSIVAE